ncbi:MAG: elongation factor G [Pirellulales bacterium]
MVRKTEQLRNFGIIAHIDAGKTTVTERMLYCSGSIHRAGEVDKGTTETDFDEEEQQRGITIYSACVTFRWKDVEVNLLDTPGHVDFTAEVERCLRVLDGGVVVFSAREGVEAQSETVWRQADKYRVPRICFINKMDREGADFESVVREISQRLDGHPVPIQLPVGQGPPHMADAFRAVIDLIEMKLLKFQKDKVEVLAEPIPDELAEMAELARDEMLEVLSRYSDRLTELMLEESPIPSELIHQVLREATIHLQIQPLLCGSALDGIGVQPLLDAAARYLPSPYDVPPVEGTDPKARVKAGQDPPVIRRKPDINEPFCGLVFKVLPARTGDMSWIRIYSGQLKPNSRALNPGKDKKENVAQLWRIQASRKEQVEVATCGDIVGIIGLRNTITGDTLCDPQHPILLESIDFPETVVDMAIEPDSTAERKKLADTLDLMRRQDPTFRATENEETGQTLISGMGELHLEVIKNRLLRDFNLNVKVHRPRVSYRETIGRMVEVVGECHRVLAGNQLFARVKLKLEPNEKSTQGVMLANLCDPDKVSAEWMDVLRDELRARGEGGGVIGGFPLSKLKVTILDVQSDETTTDVALRIAAGAAFEDGLRSGEPVLLEPIMRLDILTPEEHVGDFVGDLQQRRAMIARTENRGKVVQIVAEAPLAELFGYSSAMRSLSQGRAGCSMTPLEYRPAPPDVAKQFAI